MYVEENYTLRAIATKCEVCLRNTIVYLFVLADLSFGLITEHVIEEIIDDNK